MKTSLLHSMMQTKWAPWALSAVLHAAVPFAIGGLFTESPQYAMSAPVVASGNGIEVSLATLDETPQQSPVDTVFIKPDTNEQVPMVTKDADLQVKKQVKVAPKRNVVREYPKRESPRVIEAPTSTRTDANVGVERASLQQGSIPGSGTEGLASPDYLRNAPPPYPRESRLAGEEGMVLLSVGLSSFGEIEGISVRDSSGFSRLDEAALQAVRGWRFRPARVAGIGVAASILVPVKFVLR
jgi:protein TonB